MPISIRLDPETEGRLETLARATGRSKTYYIREAVLEHLADLEDTYLAAHRMENVRAGRSNTVPLEDVMKRYGLEN